MKKHYFLILLLFLTGLAGTTLAQMPVPDGLWTFDQADNLMAAHTGSLNLIPAIAGNKDIKLLPASSVNFTQTAGPTEDSKAILLPTAMALKVERAEGAEATQSYSIMMDIMMPDAASWNGLLQTDETNTSDGDLFTHDHQIGIASMGGYFSNIKDNRWYRVVLSYRDGKNILYLDGEKLVTANPDGNDRFKIQPFGFYLHCDESYETVDTYVATVAFWETPLTDEEVAAMGSAAPPTESEVMEIATADDLHSFAQRIANGDEVDGVLTADIDLSTSAYPNMMIGTEGSPFAGTFDGQGHTITYSYDFSDPYCGLFSRVFSATIRNLRVEGDVVTRGIHFGALIGRGDGEMLVENVVTNVNITGEHSGVTGNGGMIGALYGNITFNNCATLGEMGYPGSSMYCGFVAFATGGVTSTLNNCYTTCYITEGTGTDYCFTFCRGTHLLNNCYYLNAIGEVQGTEITDEMIESGSLCYKLNGDQSNIVWTQNLDGTEPFPMPNPEGKRVYASGTCRCDGAELESNPLTYSNTESYPVIPDHQYSTDGICTVCGMTDPNAVQKDENGFYLISNADQMYWLNLKVQESDAELKVLLTDDINLNDGIDPSLMIGTESRPFHGIFDGGGHTIHYDYDEVTAKWRGLFAFVKDATIRNLYVEGSVYVTDIHYGALIGRGNGTILVENVVTNVDITGARANVTGDAGMIGANYADITFNNCATLGEMGFEGSSMYSPFSGWSDGNSSTTLNNCYSTCKLKEGTGTGNCFTLTHQNGSVTINNSYYLNLIGKLVGGTQITEEQLASGELCYLLNGDQSNIGWYQILGEDEMPVPDATHLRVYGAGQTYMNITDEASFGEFVALVISEEKQRYEETKAQKILIDAYLEDLEELASASDIDAFMNGYTALADQRQAIQASADAYAAYIAKVEETITYLENNPDMNNKKVILLRSYLTEYFEPDEDYPNGSAEYILSACLLNNEEITAEAALIDKWLTEAISYNPAVGTDVSVLFTNIDLSDRYNGWEGELPTGWGTSETSPLYAAECLAANMDMYQTVTGLENGIYELRINGAFRPTPYNDFYNVNYAATLYANGIHNFFQANIEDMISVDDAIDGENCNINGPIADFPIEDEDGNVIGYTMQGIVSCCNAFQADRYPNYVLCNVTDGTLTIGVRQPGTGLSRDWLGFGNIRVYYYGQLDEADESLDRVLESQSARATTILNVYEEAIDYQEYATYPNFSQALKEELQQTLDAVPATTESAAKYALIEKFSELFLQIYECKQAYIHAMDMAEEVNGIISSFYDILSEDENMQLEDLYSKLINGYMEGSLSAEDIQAIDLKKLIDFYPEEEDGYYLLRSMRDYFVFAHLVEGGQTEINAKLLTDINLAESEEYSDLMIGTESNQFGGIFDGQGHTVTYNYEVNENYCGMFRYVNGGTIRNLTVKGNATVTSIHFGALVGWASSTVHIENVITDVDIVGDHSGVTGDGGMFGRLEGNARFFNCATLGSMGNPGSSMYCGFVAYVGNGSSILNNCYTACTLTEGTGTDYCYTFCRGSYRANNCYYLNAIGAAQGTQMSLEQFLSGEVCYKLNANQPKTVWYQTITEDDYPVLNPDHQQVLYSEDVNGKYYNLVNDVIVGVEDIKDSAGSNGSGDFIYNLAGQRLSKMQKGINIVNGKKKLVK